MRALSIYDTALDQNADGGVIMNNYLDLEEM